MLTPWGGGTFSTTKEPLGYFFYVKLVFCCNSHPFGGMLQVHKTILVNKVLCYYNIIVRFPTIAALAGQD